MAVIPTKQLFDEYFAEKPESVARKTRAQVDRQEVYNYEEKLGKQIFDMNVDELFGMMLTFGNNRRKNSDWYRVSYASFPQIASAYRSIWNYYIEHHDVIINPWNNKQMRGTEAAKRLAETKEAFTRESLDKVIETIYAEYADENRSKYLECILLLYYDGFAKAEEIVNLKESDINFKTKEVRLPGRTVKLSDRCFELLRHTHNLDMIDGWRGDYLMESWHGGYFKYIIRPKEKEAFQDRPETEIAALINRRINTDINRKLDLDINYRLLYFLGFFDKLSERVGKDRAKELVESVRSSKDTAELMAFANEYGIVIDNVTHLKKNLRPYI